MAASILSRLRMIPGSAEQTVDLGRTKGGDAINCKIRECGAKPGAFFEYCRPGETRLIDLEH